MNIMGKEILAMEKPDTENHREKGAGGNQSFPDPCNVRALSPPALVTTLISLGSHHFPPIGGVQDLSLVS